MLRSFSVYHCVTTVVYSSCLRSRRLGFFLVKSTAIRGHDAERHEDRRDEDEDERVGDAGDELADDAGDEEERREDRDGRHRAGDQRPRIVVQRRAGGLIGLA